MKYLAPSLLFFLALSVGCRGGDDFAPAKDAWSNDDDSGEPTGDSDSGPDDSGPDDSGPATPAVTPAPAPRASSTRRVTT
jgi:hypothetical protein